MKKKKKKNITCTFPIIGSPIAIIWKKYSDYLKLEGTNCFSITKNVKILQCTTLYIWQLKYTDSSFCVTHNISVPHDNMYVWNCRDDTLDEVLNPILNIQCGNSGFSVYFCVANFHELEPFLIGFPFKLQSWWMRVTSMLLSSSTVCIPRKRHPNQ